MGLVVFNFENQQAYLIDLHVSTIWFERIKNLLDLLQVFALGRS
jgi:hypothetical protein